MQLLLLLAFPFAVAQPCFGQHKVEVAPLVGVYWPTGGDYSVPAGPPNPAGSFSASVRQNSAPILGAHLTFWMVKDFAVELSGGYALRSRAISRVSQSGNGCPEFGMCTPVTDTTSTQGVTGSVRFLSTLTPPTVGVSIYLVAGFGFLKHNSPGPNAVAFDATEWDPELGVGFRVPGTAATAPRVEVQGVFAFTHLILSVGLPVTLAGGAGRAP